MKNLGKAGVFLCLMVALTLWLAAAFSQQGALGASNQPSIAQGRQNARNEDHLSHQAGRSIDRADLTLNSASVSAPTSSFSATLPIILSSFCSASGPGDPDNVADALTITSGQTVSGKVSGCDWDDVYKIWTVAYQQLTISMNGTGFDGPGDADLYLYPPSTTDIYTDPYAARSAGYDNNEFIQGTVQVGGYWYIDVFDCCEGDGGTNYNLTATLSGPGATGANAFDLPESDHLRDLSRSKTSD
jgi:hypothetical protein